MLSTVSKYLSVPLCLLKPTYVSHSLIVTRGRRLWMRPYLASLYKRRLDQGPEPNRPRSAWINCSYLKKEQEERLKLGLTEDIAQVDLTDNQQLVNLGEHAAETYIELFLQKCYPLLPSEGISAVTNYLLSTDVLGHIACNLGIKDLVQTAEFPVCTNSLSTVFKAVIGALTQDQGKQRAELFIQDFILTQLIGKDLFEMWMVSNPMGLLIDTLQKQKRPDPEPRLLWSTGSETILASYVVGIYVDRQLIGQAPGETVSIAEEMAARDALRRFWCFSHIPFDHKTLHSTGDNSLVDKKQTQSQRT